LSDKTQTLEETSTSQKSSRRSMLRLAVPAAAGVAALAAAGATEALRPGSARAAPAMPKNDGDPFALGGSNLQQHTTFWDNDASVFSGVLNITDHNAHNTGLVSYGVLATSQNTAVAGISGDAELGDPSLVKNYTGVYGISSHQSGGPGAGTGYGVIAHANRAAAPLLLVSTHGNTANGFPKTAAADGAMNVDNNGVLYSHRFGAWYGIPCMQFLPAPVRLLDARTSASSGVVNRGALTANEIYALQVGGNGGIPANAQGVIGNFTVLGPGANGNISVFPTGASTPTTASMTFLTGAFLANSVSSGIGTGGQINIQNQSGGNTPCVFDAVAFLI
jgi:hypothetical protein